MNWTRTLVCLIFGSLMAAHAAQAQDVKSDQETLIELEREWDEAFHTQNAEFIEVLLADEFIATYGDGSRGDKAKELELVFWEFAFAFGLALAFMYMILASQFESFGQPLIIMLAIPIAAPFALLSLWFADDTLNLYSALGVLVLFGMVKKNAILQVDHTNQLLRGGVPPWDAVMQGSRDRLRPILMTTLALVAGCTHKDKNADDDNDKGQSVEPPSARAQGGQQASAPTATTPNQRRVRHRTAESSSAKPPADVQASAPVETTPERRGARSSTVESSSEEPAVDVQGSASAETTPDLRGTSGATVTACLRHGHGTRRSGAGHGLARCRPAAGFHRQPDR